MLARSLFGSKDGASQSSPGQRSFPASEERQLNNIPVQVAQQLIQQNTILAELLSQRSVIKTPAKKKLCNSGSVSEAKGEISPGCRSEESLEESGANDEFKQNSHMSPWMRNAGRRKSHPVWSFFKDLRTSEGKGGVFCLHCTWHGDDRSPNNLKTHLKHFHRSDGIFQQFSAKLASTPTQPYVKRNRSLPFIPSACNKRNLKNFDQNDAVNDGASSSTDGLSAVRVALAQPQCSTEKPLNFLSTIPHNPEVIGVNAGYADDDENRLGCNVKLEENIAECSTDCAAATSELNNPGLSSNTQNHIGSDHSGSSTHSSLAPIAYAFSIFDGDSMVQLMRVASDLDCTLSFNCRDDQPQLCFESNCTVAAGGPKGPKVCLTEVESEVRILVQKDSAAVDNEYWKKTDKAQFMWAVRGKCQKVLTS